MAPPTFVGGKLNLKGDKKSKKKAKKKSKKSKHSLEDAQSRRREEDKVEDHRLQNEEIRSDDEDDEMTAAERRSMKVKLAREKEEIEKVAGQSHRERVEKFNEKLGKLTEHNDIPRISAAGNG